METVDKWAMAFGTIALSVVIICMATAGAEPKEIGAAGAVSALSALVYAFMRGMYKMMV